MIFDDDRDLVRFLPGRWQAAGVSRRTWRRWMDGSSRIPFAVVCPARLLVAGELPHGGDAWRGWMMNSRTGELVDPAGVAHTPATIAAWHWCAQELRALRGEETQEKIRRLKTGNDGAALTQALHRRLRD